MTFAAHPIIDPQDRRHRSVVSLLAPALNRDGHDADNFDLDTAIMLHGRDLLPDPGAVPFLEGCIANSIEPDSFVPGSRVVRMTAADLLRWKTIRADFAAARFHSPSLSTIPASSL